MDSYMMRIDRAGETVYRSIGVGFVRWGFRLIFPFDALVLVDRALVSQESFTKSPSRSSSHNKYCVMRVICPLVLIPKPTSAPPRAPHASITPVELGISDHAERTAAHVEGGECREWPC